MLKIDKERYPKPYECKQMSLRSHTEKSNYNWIHQIQKLFFDPIMECEYSIAFDVQSLLSKKIFLVKKYLFENTSESQTW